MIDEETNSANAELIRKKAEEQLKKETNIKSKWDKESDKSKLIHELLINQIELQLQNEQLRESNERAEMALKKYTMLFDLTPMGFFTLDADGIIHDLNFAGADMLVDRRFSLINSNFKLYVSDASKPLFNNFLNSIFANQEKESCKIKLGYDKLSLCEVYIEGIITGEDNKCLLSVVNLSTLKLL